MHRFSRPLFLPIIATALLLAAISSAAPSRERLNEEAALKVLDQTLRHDRVYKNRISLDCVSYITEEARPGYFDFVLRENHTRGCGGDSETSPVVDRYRVYRASAKMEWLDPVRDKWLPYDPVRIGRL